MCMHVYLHMHVYTRVNAMYACMHMPAQALICTRSGTLTCAKQCSALKEDFIICYSTHTKLYCVYIYIHTHTLFDTPYINVIHTKPETPHGSQRRLV